MPVKYICTLLEMVHFCFLHSIFLLKTSYKINQPLCAFQKKSTLFSIQLLRCIRYRMCKKIKKITIAKFCFGHYFFAFNKETVWFWKKIFNFVYTNVINGHNLLLTWNCHTLFVNKMVVGWELRKGWSMSNLFRLCGGDLFGWSVPESLSHRTRCTMRLLPPPNSRRSIPTSAVHSASSPTPARSPAH